MTEKTKISEQQEQVSEQQEQPVSTRDAIRAAIQEQKDKNTAEGNKVVDKSDTGVEEKVPDKVEPTEKPVVEPTDKLKPVVESTDKSDGLKKEGKDKVEKPVEAEKSKDKIPFGIRKEIRDKWTDIDDTVRTELGRLTKENLDLKSNEGRKFAHLRDVDAVLTPYVPEMQRIGVTPAQLVKRLLEYSDALASPQYKYFAIAKLANDFNIDLSIFANQDDQQTSQQTPNQSVSPGSNVQLGTIPLEVENELKLLREESARNRTLQQNTADKVAVDYINLWAGFDAKTNEYTKKPYFPHVRQAMYQLIANGSVPIRDGQVDLDAAYETACYIIPEIREMVVEEYGRAALQTAEERRQKQAKDIQKAKIAGSSAKSNAPLPNRNENAGNSRHGGNKLSVRDSIRLAISEARST